MRTWRSASTISADAHDWLMIDAAVAELPIATSTKGVQAALLSHDEAVLTASRYAAQTDTRQRFHTPRQQLLIAGAPMAALPMLVPSPAQDLALFCHGQEVGRSGGNGENPMHCQRLHWLGNSRTFQVAVTESSVLADAPGVDRACSRNSRTVPRSSTDTANADARQGR